MSSETTPLTKVERVLAAREAGNVRRCHVVPHHGEYTGGKHSFDATSLLLVLHPDPSKELIQAVLWHDAAERWVGDMPAPAKWYDANLGDAYDHAELNAIQHWEMYDAIGALVDSELKWLEAVDRLELWLWCQDQLALGNVHIREFIVHLDRSFDKAILNRRMPKECVAFYRDYNWTRLPETREGGELVRVWETARHWPV